MYHYLYLNYCAELFLKLVNLASWKMILPIILSFGSFYSYSQLTNELTVNNGTIAGCLDAELSDIDADGDLDIIYITVNDSKLHWYENLGNGNFAATVEISSGGLSFPQSIEIADLNNDGLPDIFVHSINNSSSWYASLGNGTFSPQNLLPFSASAATNRSGIVDFDNDSDLDIFLYVNGLASFFIIENMGSGNFAPEVLVADNLPDYVRDIEVADFDGDGLVDIAFYSDQTPNIGWVKNISGLSFGSPQPTVIISSNPTDLEVYDIDYDGDQDILFSAPGLGGISLLENNGAGSFTNQGIIGSCSNPESFELNHINDDGYIDIFVAISSLTSSKAIVLENQQNGTWSISSGLGTVLMNPNDICTGDIDNDSDIDAVVAYPGEIRWYENYSTAPNILKGTIFNDLNENGIWDSNEPTMVAGRAILSPGGNTSYANFSGEYIFANHTGTLSISHEGLPSSLWSLTTDSILTVTTNLNDPPIDTLNFGYSINSLQTILDCHLSGSQPICDMTNTYWIDLWNYGTTYPNGTIRLQINDSTSFISASEAPDSIVGSMIYWHYDSLHPFNNKLISYQLQMPNYLMMGNTITTLVECTETDSLGTVMSTINRIHNEILLCAYDPNDKQVSPRGTGNEGFIPLVPSLEYTIRFQNTGNFPATHITITDTLDPNLDWTSLRFLSASHPLSITVDSSGIARFKFSNIFLPDSTSNEPESHGFIKFKMNLIDGLVPGDEIRNQANIFFDFNPPIVTNTTLNTIRDPLSTNGGELLLYPNPTDGKCSLFVKGGVNNNETFVSISDLSGRTVHNERAAQGEIISLDLSHLRSGLYVLFLRDEVNEIIKKKNIIRL